MIHLRDGIAGLSLWRHEERHYLKAPPREWGEMSTWHGPLSDTEYNAFMRLCAVKECNEPE